MNNNLQSQMWQCAVCHALHDEKKSSFECGLCHSVLCKKCTVPHSQESLEYMPTIPDELKHAAYCGPCFNSTVAPALENYEELLSKAREVCVFDKSKKNPPVQSISKHKLSVSNCVDEDDALMRLAFLAASSGFDALVKVELSWERVDLSGYQTSRWHGIGLAARMR